MDLTGQLQRTLGDAYAIDREVGRGGMATVYLARDLKHDRRVAIKVLNPELGAVLGVERFLAEIKVTANLQHPNLLPLFDSGEAGGLLYYVMPFVDGETLRARLDREQQLPVEEALRLITAVANALEYAHSHGVIHRDLKPENILLQAGQPVIADFGIALAVSNAGGARVTQTGLSLGTPQYMSPEQATGDRVIDARSDQFSLAAVLYEMLTGEPPHTGGTAQIIIARLMTETARPVSATRPSVPPPVSAAIARALMKAPADRWESVAAFARALATPSVTGAAASGEMFAIAARSAAWKPRAIAVALAVVAVIAGIVWFANRGGARELDPAAVLLLPTAAGDASMTATAARIDDAMAQSIGSLPWVKLRAAHATAAPDENAAAAAAREAGAATAVTASVMASGDSAALRLRLIDAASGTVIRQLAAATIARNPSADAARQSVEPLASAVGFVTNPRLGAVTLPSGQLPTLDAFREFEAGLARFGDGNDTVSANRTIRALRKSIALDTSFTQAKLWLGLSYGWTNFISRREGGVARADTVRRWVEVARQRPSPYEAVLADLSLAGLEEIGDPLLESTRRLLALTPRSPLAFGLPYTLLDLNRPREAIARWDSLLAPSRQRDTLSVEARAGIWTSMAEAQHGLGEYDAALATIRKARALRPSDITMLGNELQTLAAMERLDELNRLLPDVATAAGNGNMFGFAGQVYVTVASELAAHGHPAEGRVLMQRAVDWFAMHEADVQASSNFGTRKALALMGVGRDDDAAALLRGQIARYPEDSRLRGLLGRIYAKQGKQAELQPILAWLEALPAGTLQGAPTYERAAITANLGREHWDEAVGLLQESLRQGQGNGIRRRLHWFTDWQPLKDYPPFRKVLEPRG